MKKKRRSMPKPSTVRMAIPIARDLSRRQPSRRLSRRNNPMSISHGVVKEVFDNYGLLSEFERTAIWRIADRQPLVSRMNHMEQKRFLVIHRRVVTRLKMKRCRS